MLKRKQLFIIIYVNVCVKRVYPHKNKQLIPCSVTEKIHPMIEFAMIELGIICAVNKSKQFVILKIWISTRTSMPRLRQNDRERAVGMVEAGMTHQAVSDHFNVSRIAIARLMIRFRQTGRTNDRPRSDRQRVPS